MNTEREIEEPFKGLPLITKVVISVGLVAGFFTTVFLIRLLYNFFFAA